MREDAVFVGIDIGGSVVKAAGFDANGREIACSGSHLLSAHPQPGHNERAPDEMWKAVASALRGVIAELPGGPHSVAGLGCTGHGNGLYLLDENLRPAGPGIVSSDTRGSSELAKFEAHHQAGWVTRRRGQRFGICEPSLLMSWLDQHEPERAGRATSVVMCKDYVRLRLTGRLETELCDASGAGLIDIAEQRYAHENFHALGLAHWLPKLPPVRQSTGLCGGVSASGAAETGLSEGTPVVAGTMDLEAVTLASGVLDDAHLVISAGTWNIAVQVMDRAVLDPLPLMQALCRDGTRYLLSEGSPTGAQNLAWLLHDVLGTPDPDWPAINRLVEALPPDSSRLIHLPFINGSGSDARGGFLGITGETSRSHLLRAVYESTAFMHKLHMAELAAVTARMPRCGRLSGGVTRSSAWCQMFADVLGIRVEVSEATELGALGCAMLASVGVGRYTCLEEAVRSMSRIVRVFEVDEKKHSVYERKYGLFLNVQKALQPHWNAFCASGSDGATRQNKERTS